jgi:hypothetical protein
MKSALLRVTYEALHQMLELKKSVQVCAIADTPKGRFFEIIVVGKDLPVYMDSADLEVIDVKSVKQHVHEWKSSSLDPNTLVVCKCGAESSLVEIHDA